MKEVSLASFYKRACYISASTYLFHKSIRESFKSYNKDITDEKMYELLEKVSLLDFIKRNNGLDFVINENSTNVSGDEKQRLVLAYYLAKDYDFYVFDEATSNIDAINEGVILNAIKKYKEDMAIVIISHRMSTLGICEKIYKLEDGRI